jgi:tRNA(Arg) A34 adenosine deaminase TadA
MKLSLQKEYIDAIKETASGKGDCSVAAALLIGEDKPLVCCPNAMLENDDPTAHAAVVALRLKRGEIRNKTSKCVLLLSEKPCPMCMSGIYQAKIDNVFYLQHDEIKHLNLSLDNTDHWYEKINTAKD